MRKYALTLLVLLVSVSAFAQDRDDRDDQWRRRRAYSHRDNSFEITPFIGYRWGGTIFADQTLIFNRDVDVKASANFGAALGIPIGDSGMKLELMANRQSSELETGGGLFDPSAGVADIDVTYLHAGIQVPFGASRNATPYIVVSAGLANLDPDIRGVNDENRFSASAGVGVKMPVTDNLAFRFEGRGYFTYLEDRSDCTFCNYYYNQNFYQGEVNLGLTFSF